MAKKNFINLCVILIIAFFNYLPIFKLGFTNYDDQRYILDNIYLTFSFENIIYFFTNFFDGHYHPITMLSLMLDNLLFNNNATGYHVTNLLLHLFNIAILYFFILKLFKERSIAFFTVLLFAVSPMGVETVAWLSERKNLLYAFFFLLSLNFYVNYCDKSKSKFYFLTLVTFIFSLLSKVQAITLPIALLLIDYYQEGFKINRKKWLEKIPFIILSILFVIVAHYAQLTYWNDLSSGYSLLNRIVFASYALTLYVVKLVIPFNLSALYPYPVEVGQDMPLFLYLFLIPAILYLTMVFFFIRRNRTVSFALLFFGINIVLLLKITGVPYGNYFMADRYAYIASIGIFLLISYLLVYLTKKLNRWKYLLYFIFGLYIAVLIGKTMSQCNTWKNGVSLWSNVLRYYPEHYQAWNDLGTAYSLQNDLIKAESSFKKAILINPKRAIAYNNLGNLYAKSASFNESIVYFDRAIDIDPGYTAAYNNRGLAFEKSGNYKKAVDDFETAVKLKPEFFIAWLNLSNTYYKTGNYNVALEAVNKALKLNPDAVFVYELKAHILFDDGNFSEAIILFKKLKKSGNSNSNIDQKLGICYYYQKKFDKAFESLSIALQQEPENPETYKFLGYTAYNLGNFTQSVDYLNKALAKINNDPLLYAMRGMAKIRIANSDACYDLQKAYEMGLKEIEKSIEIYCK